jgi:hypothetical protein
MKRTIFLSTLLVASAASAQVELPVQGFLTDSGAAVVGSQTLEFRVVDDAGADRTCESQALTLDAGFFTALLGQSGAAACGTGEPTVLDPVLFRVPLSLEVSLSDGTVLGLFPLGDAPSAGFAQVAQRVVDELPNVVRADDAQSLVDALATAAGGGPTVIEIGAGTYALASPATVPDNTDIRGYGQLSSTISGGLVLQGNNRLSGLRVTSAVSGPVVQALPAAGETLELFDVRLTGTPGSGETIGLLISSGDDSTEVVIKDSRVEASVGAVNVLGIFDQAGVDLRVDDTEIDIDSTGQLVVGLRIGDSATSVPTYSLRLNDVRILAFGGTAFAAGIETFSNSGGFARLTDANVRVVEGGGIAIAINGGDVRVHSSLLFADRIGFVQPGLGSLRIASSGIESFINDPLATGSDPIACVLSYNDATGGTVDATCN